MVLIGEWVLVLLAVIGLSAVCYKLADFLLRPAYQTEMIVILPFSGHVENMEQQLRYYIAKYKKLQKNPEVGWLICLDEGMTEETRHICELVCNDYEFMNLCTVEQLQKLIS